MAVRSSKKSLHLAEPGVGDVHVPVPDNKKPKKELTTAFLSHLHGQLKDAKADVSLEDFKSMVSKSRAHAGGKAKAANRQSAVTASEGINYSKIIEMINAELREEFSSPLYGMGCYPWAREVYDDHVIVSDDEGGFFTIPYTMSPDGDIEFGDAQEVEQTFTPIAAGEIITRCADGNGYRLFMEQQFVEPPEWLSYLPSPGTYTHQEYGKIEITQEGNEQFASQFNDGVYQTYQGEPHVPIDAEHQTKLSGAVGWINELRVNEDGSVDAKTEWTERGEKLLKTDQFKFFSPEWYSSWTDPATEQTYSNVAIGGAITTRPWFKEKGGLKPIVANEKGIQCGEIHKTDGEVTIIFTALAPNGGLKPMATKEQIEAARALVKAADAKTAGEATEEQIKTARALIAAEDKKETKQTTEAAPTALQFAEMQTQLKQATEDVKKANERAAVIEKDNRAMKFTETVKDWPGETAKNVAMLEHLFSTSEQGRDSEVFKSHVETMNATATQLKASSLFTEVGSTGAPSTGSAEAEANALAKKMSEDSNGKLTTQQAYREVIAKTPGLYERIQKEAN